MDETNIDTNSNNEESNEFNQNSIATKKPACDYCKRRKIKCDSQQPCFQCSKRGINCEYLSPAPKPQTGVVAKLIKKVDQLSYQLVEQKKIADYWRNLYEDKENHIKFHDAKNNENRRMTSDKPRLSESTREFCSNVLAAVSAVRKAFLDVMKTIMPLNTPEYDIEYASIFWNRLIGTVPADLVTNIQNTTATNETIVQMLLHSSIFALGKHYISLLNLSLKRLKFPNEEIKARNGGSILLIDTLEEDLAVHFNQCFDALLGFVNQIEITSLQLDVLRQIPLSLLYTMLYYKINGFYNNISSLWQRTVSLLNACQPGLDEESLAEFNLCLVILDPTQSGSPGSASLFQFHELKPYDPDTQPQRQVLNVVSQVVLALIRNKTDAESNSLIWNYLNEAESKLEQLQPPYYHFFGAWIFSLKALFAVHMNNGMHDEIHKCISIALKLYNGITNAPERAWLSRDLEHLHFVLSKVFGQFKDENSLNSTLGVLYTIIMQMSSTENENGSKSESESSITNSEYYFMQVSTN